MYVWYLYCIITELLCKFLCFNINTTAGNLLGVNMLCCHCFPSNPEQTIRFKYIINVALHHHHHLSILYCENYISDSGRAEWSLVLYPTCPAGGGFSVNYNMGHSTWPHMTVYTHYKMFYWIARWKRFLKFAAVKFSLLPSDVSQSWSWYCFLK